MEIFKSERVVRARYNLWHTEVHYVSFSHLIFQIMDCKYYSGNQLYLPVLKEDVGEDVKDECKAGPPNSEKGSASLFGQLASKQLPSSS